MNYKKLLSAVGFFWLGGALVAQAQILNDSSQSVYGSATTLVLYEADIFKGNLTPSRIDTSLTNMQVLRHWYYDSTLKQDLGNVGTATQPLFWQMPMVLGNRLGRNAFDPYTVNGKTLEYYDTKSPFTYLNYVQGSLGEQIFRAKHTRNIKPNWNVGVGYERVGSDRRIGFTGNQAKGMVSHYGLLAFTHYFSKNERYRLMANVSQTSHDQIELGGIRPAPGDTRDSLYDYLSEPVWLNQAATDEKRTDFHATHWYKLLGAGLQLYHTLDYNTQANEFSDESLTYEGEKDKRKLVFYPRARLDGGRTADDSYFRQLENTFGVMGSSRLFVYRAYAKRRDGSYTLETRGVEGSRDIDGNTIWLPYQTKIKRTLADNFIGGEAQFRLKNDIYVTTDAELQIGGGDYKINAQARFKFLTLRQTRVSYTPTLLQRVFISNHFEWFNDFKNTQATQTAALVEAQLGNHYVSGQLQFTNLVNHVYYQDSSSAENKTRFAEPVQTSASINLLQGNLRYKFTFRSLVLDNLVYYNSTTGPDVIRMPRWYVNSKTYIQRPMFKNAINIQVGAEMNWHESYYADGYMPVTQQFHVQNEFVISRYPTLDVFLNTDIKTLNIFLKASHLNTAIPGWEQGYFVTPYYVANPFSFIFGIRWNFYD